MEQGSLLTRTFVALTCDLRHKVGGTDTVTAIKEDE